MMNVNECEVEIYDRFRKRIKYRSQIHAQTEKKNSFVFSNVANDFLQFSSNRARLTFEFRGGDCFSFLYPYIQLRKEKQSRD